MKLYVCAESHEEVYAIDDTARTMSRLTLRGDLRLIEDIATVAAPQHWRVATSMELARAILEEEKK